MVWIRTLQPVPESTEPRNPSLGPGACPEGGGGMDRGAAAERGCGLDHRPARRSW